jgi:DNA adenine methylase
LTVSDEEQIKFWRNSNRTEKKIVNIPRPFLKWAGGKRQLIKQLDGFIPAKFKTYIEPFVGGGAMFFYLLPKKAILMDTNKELINCYQVIKEDVNSLIMTLSQHKNEKEYYYNIRNKDRHEDFLQWTDVDRASRTIYLNRCCYNGLYRVNKKGQFNVPFGRYKNPRFLDEINLKAVNIALRNTTILHESFEACVNYAKRGDYVYFDPPYFPISRSANFTSYTKDNFGREMQQTLFKVFLQLDKKGCKVMLSNSHSSFILDLYSEYYINTLTASRAINSDASKRGKIKEVLITNYTP